MLGRDKLVIDGLKTLLEKAESEISHLNKSSKESLGLNGREENTFFFSFLFLYCLLIIPRHSQPMYIIRC